MKRLNRPLFFFLKYGKIVLYFKKQRRRGMKKRYFEEEEERRPKATIILAIICIVLLIATAGVMYYAHSTINNLREEIDKLEEEAGDMVVKNYRYAAAYYLDNVATVASNDETFYHRERCPQLKAPYVVRYMGTAEAENEGYKECHVCYDLSIKEYVKKYFKKSVNYIK